MIKKIVSLTTVSIISLTFTFFSCENINKIDSKQELNNVEQKTFKNSLGKYNWKAYIPKKGETILVDQKTGSKFNLRGEAFSGPLSEKKILLTPVNGVNMFWFAWSIFFSGSDIFGSNEKLRKASLEPTSGVIGCSGGFDCIPSLPNTGKPEKDLNWFRVSEADYLNDDDMVMGVFYNGAARAYPHKILWFHEIVNDQIDDTKFTISYCPLTGSGLTFDASETTFGVSGQLFNSNLIMYDHKEQKLWSQLWTASVEIDKANNDFLKMLPNYEMTWKRWKELYPDTLVLNEETGSAISYTTYPYGNYLSEHNNTFRKTEPDPDKQFLGKEMTYGIFDRSKKIAKTYLHSNLEKEVGESGAIKDKFDEKNIVIVYEKEAKLALAFFTKSFENILDLESEKYDGE